MSVGDGRTAGNDTKIRGTVVSTSLCQRILPEYKSLPLLDTCENSVVTMEARLTTYAPFHDNLYHNPFLCPPIPLVHDQAGGTIIRYHRDR
jgi:hypothetical protein